MQIIVMIIYITYDIISRNLVLIVLVLYRFSVQTFLNALKCLGDHDENSVTMPLLKAGVKLGDPSGSQLPHLIFQIRYL